MPYRRSSLSGWRARTPKGKVRGRARAINQEGPGSRYPGIQAGIRRHSGEPPVALAIYGPGQLACAYVLGTHTCARGEGESRRGLTARGVSLYVRRAWPGSANRGSHSLARSKSAAPKSKASKNFSGRVKRHGERKGISALDLGLHFPSASRARPLSSLRLLFSAASLSPDLPSSISSLLDFLALHVLVRLLS